MYFVNLNMWTWFFQWEKYLDKICYEQKLMFHPRDLEGELTLRYVAGMISLTLLDSVSVLNLIIIILQLKNLENQIEEEYDDKKKLQQEKRDLERQIQELSSKAGSRDKGGSEFLDVEIIVIKTLIRKIDVDYCCCKRLLWFFCKTFTCVHC